MQTLNYIEPSSSETGRWGTPLTYGILTLDSDSTTRIKNRMADSVWSLRKYCRVVYCRWFSQNSGGGIILGMVPWDVCYLITFCLQTRDILQYLDCFRILHTGL